MPHKDDKIKLVGASETNHFDLNRSHGQCNRHNTLHLSLAKNYDRECDYLFNKYTDTVNGKSTDCYCKQSFLSHIRFIERPTMEGKFIGKYANIRFIGFVLFVIASVFCLYKIYELHQSDESTNHFPAMYSTKLKLVSVFNRHGDRAPSDSLPDNDPHKDKSILFWPNGMSNLTEAGRMRQFRIGLELRRRYDRLLDYNASHFMAFSSPIYRCQESTLEILRGLFDIENIAASGRKLAERYNIERGMGESFCFKGDDLIQNNTYCKEQNPHSKISKNEKVDFVLPVGSGFPQEYQKVKIDLDAVPVLTWEYLTNCRWRRENPTPVDDNLLNSKAVAQLKGVNKLVKLLKGRYNMDLNFTALGLWSSINNEILLSRTRDTIKYSEHYLDWVDTALPEYKRDKITLYDLWEQVAVLAYRDRIADTAHYIQYGPIITSLLKSQAAALSHQDQSIDSKNSSDKSSVSSEKDLADKHSDDSSTGTFADSELYRDKKMIIYLTHDSILQQLMMNLSLVHIEPEDFETRFHKWRKTDDVSQFLAGYKMSRFGMSLVFELYETELKVKRKPDATEIVKNQSASIIERKKFPFIQAVLYNQADGKFKPVEYKRLKFGRACQQRFKSLKENIPRSEVDAILARFYDPEFPLDKDLSCPYELFKQVVNDYLINPSELDKLCKG